MPPKPSHSELIAVQVMREQEWVYDCRRRHLSVAEISRYAARPERDGGLGYYLSPHQVKGLLNGYLERMRDTLDETPAEAMQQELADLDMQYRAAAALVTPTTGFQITDPETGEISEERRDERVILAALEQLRRIGERRAKLLGTDATVKSAIDVTMHDATDTAIRELAAEFDKASKR